MLIRIQLDKQESDRWEEDSDEGFATRATYRGYVVRVASTLNEPTRLEDARGLTLYSIGC